MLGFLMGVAVGAGGYWAYRFWKGEDTSWEQSFPSTGSSSDYGSSSSSSFGSSASSQVGGGSSPTAMGGGVSGSATAEGTRTTPE